MAMAAKPIRNFHLEMVIYQQYPGNRTHAEKREGVFICHHYQYLLVLRPIIADSHDIVPQVTSSIKPGVHVTTYTQLQQCGIHCEQDIAASSVLRFQLHRDGASGERNDSEQRSRSLLASVIRLLVSQDPISSIGVSYITRSITPQNIFLSPANVTWNSRQINLANILLESSRNSN